MGLLLQSNGHDPSNFTAAQFDDALAKLKKAVDAGQIRKFTGNDYAQDLAKGDIAACICWSGDVIQLGFENEKIKFVVPGVRGDALVGQHAGAEQGHPQGQRRSADQLLLRAGGGREARRVRQLHLPGRRARRPRWRRSTRTWPATR